MVCKIISMSVAVRRWWSVRVRLGNALAAYPSVLMSVFLCVNLDEHGDEQLDGIEGPHDLDLDLEIASSESDLDAPVLDELGRFCHDVLRCDSGAKEGIEQALRRYGVQQVSFLEDCGLEQWRTEFGMTFYQASIMVKTLAAPLPGGRSPPRIVFIFCVYLLCVFFMVKTFTYSTKQ